MNRCSCTLRDFSPTESHAKSLEVLERKGNSSSGRRGRRLGASDRVAPCSRTSAPTAWRTVKPPALSGRRSRRPSLAVFGGALSTDSPISKCCSHGTLLHLGLHASHLNICYFHQDLHRTELRRVLAHALPRSDRVLLLDPLCGDRASTGRDASAPSIFGVR